jgi:hypothetical protein
MSTVSETKPKVKTCVMTCEPFAIADGDLGVLITTLAGKKGCCTPYRCTRIDCDDLAYRLEKLHSQGSDPECENYDVNLSTSTCDCKGHARHGFCKHLAATRHLFEKGVLP